MPVIKKCIFLIGFLLIANTTAAAIHENKTSLKFTSNKEENKDIQGYALRMIEFKKFKESNEKQFAKKNFSPYLMEDNRQYISLIPFIELLQFSDFRVSPKRDYAITYSASCQKKVASAEVPWKCDLKAIILNDQGYFRGDMEGDFKKVEFHKTQPYVFLIRDTAGDSEIYAEVYDMEGSKIRSIKSFDDSMLENVIK